MSESFSLTPKKYNSWNFSRSEENHYFHYGGGGYLGFAPEMKIRYKNSMDIFLIFYTRFKDVNSIIKPSLPATGHRIDI